MIVCKWGGEGGGGGGEKDGGGRRGVEGWCGVAKSSFSEFVTKAASSFHLRRQSNCYIVSTEALFSNTNSSAVSSA